MIARRLISSAMISFLILALFCILPVTSSVLYTDVYRIYMCDLQTLCPPCHCPSAIPPKTTTEYMWDFVVVFGSTLEVLIRGFSLGFGLRMTKYVFDMDNLDNFREKCLISAICGISMAAVIHGSSLFIPLHWRELWFEY